ncbi:MAG: hypothetical protein GF418_14805 [Chitinivibrionales bacterium]|nr:hypothetical protein [Chitinivibrionales bacterium]MBD3396890.1 hypothetical protein [Chitinivibrionales bacterium]
MYTRFLAIAIPVVCALCARADVTFDLTLLASNECFACGVYAVGDIDQDGANDIVAGEGSPRLVWYPYPISADTKHTIASSASLGFEIHLGDVDNDGDLDVMSSGAGITWWENPLLPGGNPATDSWEVHEFGSSGGDHNGGSHDFKAGDIDGDGWVDGVERGQNTGQYIVYLNDQAGGWSQFSVNASRGGEGTWLGDVDGDGDLDLTDGWAWFECPDNPASESWTQHDVGNAGYHLTRSYIADINEDGNMDILVSPTEFGGSKLVWWEAPDDPKTGPWTEHILVEYNDPNFHTLQVGDIDLDGHLDVLVGSTHGPNSDPKLLWIFYNTNGDGLTWEEQKWNSPGGCWQGILGDVGSDGDLDILTVDYSGGNQGEFYENTLDPDMTAVSHRRAAPDARQLSGPSMRMLFTPDGTASAPYVIFRESSGTGNSRVFDLRGKRVSLDPRRLERPPRIE